MVSSPFSHRGPTESLSGASGFGGTPAGGGGRYGARWEAGWLPGPGFCWGSLASTRISARNTLSPVTPRELPCEPHPLPGGPRPQLRPGSPWTSSAGRERGWVCSSQAAVLPELPQRQGAAWGRRSRRGRAAWATRGRGPHSRRRGHGPHCSRRRTEQEPLPGRPSVRPRPLPRFPRRACLPSSSFRGGGGGPGEAGGGVGSGFLSSGARWGRQGREGAPRRRRRRRHRPSGRGCERPAGSGRREEGAPWGRGCAAAPRWGGAPLSCCSQRIV